MSDHHKTYIAIMAHAGWATTLMMVRLLQWSQTRRNGDHLVVKPVENGTPVDSARNWAAKRFLESDCDRILYWDHDILPPENALDALLAHDVDVVSALCLMLKMPHEKMAGIHSASFVKDEASPSGFASRFGEGLEEVDVCTGGFFVVKREILERIKRPFAFLYDEDGLTRRSEEFWFADRVHEIGGKIFTDFNVICDHKKQTRLLPLIKKEEA